MSHLSKISFIIFAAILFVNCSDENPSNPDSSNDNSARPFPLNIGNYWNYKDKTNEMELKTVNMENSEWAINFWDTSNRITKMTYIVEKTVFKGTFPEREYFGFFETDSGTYFGSRNHPLVTDYYPTEFFTKLFFIPKNLPTDTLLYKNITGTMFGEEYYASDSTIIIKSDFSYQDSVYLAYNIYHYSRRTGYNEHFAGQEYIYSPKAGFFKFWNYTLDVYKLID